MFDVRRLKTRQSVQCVLFVWLFIFAPRLTCANETLDRAGVQGGLIVHVGHAD